MNADAQRADLLIVIGTSLNVQPIADLPKVMRHVPSILINREPVGHNFDAELLGDCSDVVESVQAVLGWKGAEGEVREPVRIDRNRFVFPSENPLGTAVVETGRASFLRTPARKDARDHD
jgi:thiamine pyrophosphate-dependent acetolactate synthase large subunit-like protein